MKKLLALALILVLALSVLPAFAEEENLIDPDKKILWIEVAAITYQEDLAKGMQQCCDDYGYTFEKFILSEATPAATVEAMNTYAAMGYKLMMVYPLGDGTALDGAMTELKDYDVHMVTIGAPGTIGGECDAYVGPSNVTRMTAMAEAAAADINYKGKVGLGVCSVNDSNAQIGWDTFKSVFAQYPDIEIAWEVVDIDELSKGAAQLEAALAANPDTDAVVTTGTEVAEPLGPAIQSFYESTGKMVNGYGVDDSEVMLSEVREGWLKATYTVNPVANGYLGAYMCILINEGYSVDKTEENWCTYVEPLAITKDNIDTYTETVQQMITDTLPALDAKFGKQ